MFLLAQGAVPDSRRTDGATPLWIAAQMGHDHVVRQLLKVGANVDANRHVSFVQLKFKFLAQTLDGLAGCHFDVLIVINLGTSNNILLYVSLTANCHKLRTSLYNE
jgi:ankyrin repeat protein